MILIDTDHATDFKYPGSELETRGAWLALDRGIE